MAEIAYKVAAKDFTVRGQHYRAGDKVMILPALTADDRYCIAVDVGIAGFVSKECIDDDIERTIRNAAHEFVKNHPPMRAADAFIWGAKYMYSKLNKQQL